MDRTTLEAELAEVRLSLARLAAKANCIAAYLREIAQALSGTWELQEQVELTPKDQELVRTDTSVTLERGEVGFLLAEVSELRCREVNILRKLGRTAKASSSRAGGSETVSSAAEVGLPRRRKTYAGACSFAQEAQ